MIPDICSMYILLVAATPFEIQPSMDFLENTPSGQLNHEIGVSVTGIGSIATTHTLMRHIGRKKPDLIIQAGIAGSFLPGRSGDVLVIKEESLADLGVWEKGHFKTIFDLKLKDKDDFPFSNALLINPYNKLLSLTGLEQVRAVTVNEITTDIPRIHWYQQNIHPVVESMEGGGLHYTGLQENIAFLQFRSISNDIGERDKTKWDFPAAINNLNVHLITLLLSLNIHDKSIIEK